MPIMHHGFFHAAQIDDIFLSVPFEKWPEVESFKDVEEIVK